ncbi:aminoglycoside phosphotransferase family protein [Nocardioides sp. NBC_00368]|uniref:phosphotransferase enzyme family protein n=1 Tax=Nocardioides sp. NBC_00368 TaxID=2976000 RepID=UPI002E1A4694
MNPPPVLGSGEILAAACRRAGLSAADAQLLSAGENHVYRLPHGAIARVSKPGQEQAARREVFLGRWLNTNGVRAVHPYASLDVEQPVIVEGHPVTFWHDLGDHRPGTPREVAAALKQLHSLPTPDTMVAQVAPFVRLEERINAATWLRTDDRTWLLARLEDLQAAWTDRPRGLSDSLIHGDAWAGNVVSTVEGVTFLDLERCTIGPPEWDLTSTACRVTSYSTLSAEDYADYCEAYGRDVTRWDGFDLFRDIRELRVTCYAAYRAQHDPALRSNAVTRVDCLRGMNGPRPWRWDPLP